MSLLPCAHHADLWRQYAAALRPPPRMRPDEFAARYRKLHAVYSESPGPWSNERFPYQPHVMNLCQEALETGKRGVVHMKGGQVGGTDTAINEMLWLKEYLPGPQLFLTSTEDVAIEFGRERFEPIIRDCPPLMRRYLPNPRGDMLVKRFTDGKIQLVGGQSVFKLQSTPYRVVVIDEVDSLVESLGGQGDPVRLAEVRTDAFLGQTLMIVYAHPSVRTRGAAKLYYDSSDQRRAMVTHGCGKEFYFRFDDVAVRPGGDKSDPDSYVYLCPGCGAEISDAQRVLMMRSMRFRSVLPPEEAAKKSWIGAQFGQLLSPQKTIRSFAQRWIACGEDENARRVFVNKVLGEPYEPKVRRVDPDTLRGLMAVRRRANDPEFYQRGQVPPWVRFLTAGQDSRSVALHFSIWGWGLRRTTDAAMPPLLCGALIDWGMIERPYSLTFSEAEFHVFDDLIYRASFPSCLRASVPSCLAPEGTEARRHEGTKGRKGYHVVQCGHDVGYPPTQVPVMSFCRHWPNRAVPVKGASLIATSASRAPYARWGSAVKFRAGETVIEDESSRLMMLNTFSIKTDLFGWMDPSRRIEVMDPVMGPRKISRLVLPEEVDDQFLAESAAEALGAGKRKDEMVWEKTGPNHYADCNTYALGLALNLDPFQRGRTVEEIGRPDAGTRGRGDAESGGGGEGERGRSRAGGWGMRGRGEDPAMG